MKIFKLAGLQAQVSTQNIEILSRFVKHSVTTFVYQGTNFVTKNMQILPL
jgi:hypothetical protein